LLVSSACEEPFFDEDPVNDPETNFEILWRRMNERYSFFEYKGIDWDSVYTVYRPRVNSETGSQELFDIMEVMLNTLRDAHVNLRTDFDISFYNYHKDAPANFDFFNLEKNYLGNYKITGRLINSIIDSVGYIHYRSFQQPVTEEELDFLVARFKGLRGLIIDIRNNEGGDPANGYRIARRIATERVFIYSTVYKDGPGPNDFTAPSKAYLDTNDAEKFDMPVVVLTNRVTYSAGNFFTAMMKAIPDVTIMGDTTGGGGGVPLGWELPNGWFFNFSNSITSLPDGFIIEDGIVPDIAVQITDSDMAAGRDTILEEAIKLLKSN
ncbi:MAG: S41 family peptidase, partial [Bacteroidota bacterium]